MDLKPKAYFSCAKVLESQLIGQRDWQKIKWYVHILLTSSSLPPPPFYFSFEVRKTLVSLLAKNVQTAQGPLL